MAKKGSWGGARTPGVGKKLGPPKNKIKLTDAATEKLRRIWRARSIHEPGLTEDEIVNALIMQAAEPIEDNEVEHPPSTDASAPFDAFRELRADGDKKPIIL